MFEKIAVLLIVLICLIFMAVKFIRIFSGKGSCGCGCDECKSKDSCSTKK